MKRPTGITILGILAIIGGLLGLCGGVAALGIGGLAAGSLGAGTAAGGVTSAQAAQATGAIFVSAVVLLVLAVLYFILGIGFLQMKGWAWTLGIIVSAVSIVFSIFSIVMSGGQGIVGNVISIAISAFIIYYLFTPNVKQAFGRA